ncbi:hypothetical protein K438DRAFT_1980154 [Mycena galopus ATCC 62051]|nr:hypothetical protein K438DRAFT_1980154 [Mycena galopus ATCC 62051]
MPTQYSHHLLQPSSVILGTGLSAATLVKDVLDGGAPRAVLPSVKSLRNVQYFLCRSYSSPAHPLTAALNVSGSCITLPPLAVLGLRSIRESCDGRREYSREVLSVRGNEAEVGPEEDSIALQSESNVEAPTAADIPMIMTVRANSDDPYNPQIGIKREASK